MHSQQIRIKQLELSVEETKALANRNGENLHLLRVENDKLLDERNNLVLLLQIEQRKTFSLDQHNSDLQQKHDDIQSENEKLREVFIELQKEFALFRTNMLAENDSLKKQLAISNSNRIHLKETVMSEHQKNQTAVIQVNYLREKLENKNKETVVSINQKDQIIGRIISFAKRVWKEGDNLPQLGDNNIEERQVQKFVNKIVLEAEKFKDFVLNEPGSYQENMVPEMQNCKSCDKPFRFAKCFMRTCGSVFHEECVSQWSGKSMECTECHKDSIRLEGTA